MTCSRVLPEHEIPEATRCPDHPMAYVLIIEPISPFEGDPNGLLDRLVPIVESESEDDH